MGHEQVAGAGPVLVDQLGHQDLGHQAGAVAADHAPLGGQTGGFARQVGHDIQVAHRQVQAQGQQVGAFGHLGGLEKALRGAAPDQVLGCAAEQAFARRIHGLEDALDVEHEHGVRGVVDDDAAHLVDLIELALRGEDGPFGGILGAQVTQHAQVLSLAPPVHGVDRQPQWEELAVGPAAFGAATHAVEPHVLQLQEGFQILASPAGRGTWQQLAQVGVAQLGFGVAKDAVHRLVHPQDVACGRHREDAFVGVVEHGPQARFTVEGLLMQGFCQTRRLPVTLCPQAQQPPQNHGAGRAAHEQGCGGRLKRGAIRRAGLPPGGSAEQQAAGEHDPGADMQPACFLFGSCDLGLHSVVSCQSHQLTFRERQASVRSSEETTSHAGLIQIDTRNKG